jgi:hypothetical protein
VGPLAICILALAGVAIIGLAFFIAACYVAMARLFSVWDDYEE